MKKFFVILLALTLSLSLWACNDQQAAAPDPLSIAPATEAPVYEVRITLENLFDYFEYREYIGNTKAEDGSVTSVQVSYGLALREGYTAANSPEYKDSMSISFTADGVVLSGDFDVDYASLQYTGVTESSQTTPVSETLRFWPKGDRTTTWAFGNYSQSYITYLENFTITSASGSVYLKMA